MFGWTLVSNSTDLSAIPVPVGGNSPTRRAWARFRRNRLGYWSLLVFCAVVLLSLAAELISNDRPLLVRYQGQFYVPVLQDHAETTFGGDFQTPTDYLDPVHSGSARSTRKLGGLCAKPLWS